MTSIVRMQRNTVDQPPPACTIGIYGCIRRLMILFVKPAEAHSPKRLDWRACGKVMSFRSAHQMSLQTSTAKGMDPSESRQAASGTQNCIYCLFISQSLLYPLSLKDQIQVLQLSDRSP